MEMFNYELKLVIDICKKWTSEKCLRKNNSLDMFSKINFKKKNPVDFYKTKYVICNFNIGVATTNELESEEMTYYDFVVQKEHCFLRNIFDQDNLKKSKNMDTIGVYFAAFEKFLKIVALLENQYTSNSNIEDVSEECLIDFFRENQIYCFLELFLDISECDVKNVRALKKTKIHQIKIINFIYKKKMDFPNDEFDVKKFVSKNFFDAVLNLLYNDIVIYYPHLNGEIFGYAHDFCNQKVKESRSPILVIAHSLFKSDSFFVLKDLRLCVWRSKKINIGGRNLTDVQYANIADQVKFIDTVKYYQQSLSNLAENLDKKERQNIRNSSLHIIQNHPFYSLKFSKLGKDDQNWVLDYLCGGKGVPCFTKITRYIN